MLTKIECWWPGQANFFNPETVTSGSFKATLAARMHGVSFESPEQRPIEFCLVKTVAALLRYFFLSQSTSITLVFLINV